MLEGESFQNHFLEQGCWYHTLIQSQTDNGNLWHCQAAGEAGWESSKGYFCDGLKDTNDHSQFL